MRKALRTIAFKGFGLLVLLTAACLARAQDAKTPYPSIAPLEQYLMERNAEIALARSAAAQPITADADVMVGFAFMQSQFAHSTHRRNTEVIYTRLVMTARREGVHRSVAPASCRPSLPPLCIGSSDLG